MPQNLLHGHSRPIAQNLVASGVYDFIRQGVATLVTWLAIHQTSVTPGWSVPWAILIGAIVFLCFSIAMRLLLRDRSSHNHPGEQDEERRVYMSPEEKQALLDERKTANDNYLKIKTEHTPCERTISNLQSQVRRLQERDQTSGIQISARDGQIEQLQTQLDSFKWLHDIADEQGRSIHRFISLTRCLICKHELFRPNPYIEFQMVVTNRSIYDIEFLRISGAISFHGRELTGTLAWTRQPSVLTWGNETSISFRQNLSADDVPHLLTNEEQPFDFSRLEIKAGGVDPRCETKELHLPAAPTNEILLIEYPKLEIQVNEGLIASFIVNLQDWSKGSGGFVTMPVTIRNNRAVPVIVDSVELKVTQGDLEKTAIAERGETWAKMFIDKEGQLQRSDRKLNNLADRLPMRIQRAEMSGDFQFVFKSDRVLFLRQNIRYELILTDKSGEIHSLLGVMNPETS